MSDLTKNDFFPLNSAQKDEKVRKGLFCSFQQLLGLVKIIFDL